MTIQSSDLNKLKAIVGMFHEEMKSNSITDFIIWLDCKMEYNKEQEIKR